MASRDPHPSPLLLAALAFTLGACSDDLERVEYNDDGWVKRGTLKDGKKHGQWVSVDPDGRLWSIEVWRSGYQHGLARRWHENGELLSDRFYRHDRAQGRFRIFFDNDQIAELGWMRRGRPTGTWCEWEVDGRLEKIVEYYDGHKASEKLAPEGPCPLTQGVGRKHLDPANMDYE